jgi:signal transduction histidine kinase
VAVLYEAFVSLYMGVPGGLLEGALATLPVEVAILDADGVIVYTNEAWGAFGEENDLEGDASAIGVDYLSVSRAAGADEHARRAAAGVEGVLAGEEDMFTMEYPCHGPDEQRWFLMYAKPYAHGGERYVQMGHVDITERKLAELDVREKNDRLEAVASVLSHDIRNPLNVASGFLERLREHVDGEAPELNRIRSALDRIDAIVADALVLAREAEVESPEPVSLRERARAAWEHVETGSATLAIEDDLRFEADASVLGNLLENLFRNAVEHDSTGNRSETDDSVEHGSADGGRAGDGVTVRVGTLPDAEGFYVADDGPGIPESERDRIFEAGVSGGNGGTNSGLGLFIVEEVCAAHGWSVAATESETGGARFEVRGVTALTAEEV